ncbi:MAG: hypothetical protein AB1540_15525 [Bdellovibrionota bacterium]
MFIRTFFVNRFLVCAILTFCIFFTGTKNLFANSDSDGNVSSKCSLLLTSPAVSFKLTTLLADSLRKLAADNEHISIMVHVDIKGKTHEGTGSVLQDLLSRLGRLGHSGGSYYIPSNGFAQGYFLLKGTDTAVATVLESPDVIGADKYVPSIKLPEGVHSKIQAKVLWDLTGPEGSKQVEVDCILRDIKPAFRIARDAPEFQGRTPREIFLEVASKEYTDLLIKLKELEALGLTTTFRPLVGSMVVKGSPELVIQALEHPDIINVAPITQISM